MAKLWKGRTKASLNPLADELNCCIGVDKRLFRNDIDGSIAHAMMLGRQGIIPDDEAELICAELHRIKYELESGELEFDMTAEDIHMFVESVLTERIGETGKKIHTARSRNDQVALDMRLYMAEQIDEISDLIKALIASITDKAEENINVVMPGYTHLQRAQPILWSHQMMAYVMMLERDLGRLHDCRERMMVSPIGSCALAGTTYDTDREYEAELLGFARICHNSIDSVSDRDHMVEFLSAASIIMLHLSRLSEELILWSSLEFGFVTLDDSFTTGSSIMPQKKNPDMAELCRGKTGRVYGDLMSLLTTLKGLPLAYNKDMQEDKEAVFDAIDTLILCLKVYSPMIESMSVNRDAMINAVRGGYINATDLADYLTCKGLPFRDAYRVSGEAVALCIASGRNLETMSLEEYRSLCSLIDSDVYEHIDIRTCVEKRTSAGGTSTGSVKAQIEYVRSKVL